MTNPRIGQLAGLLLDMEDRGPRATSSALYASLKAEYTALKAAPASWSDVLESKWNLGQAQAAVAFWTADGTRPDALASAVARVAALTPVA